ncbi:carbon storage regulator [Ktedonobacter racemifer]|uniref:Translational regulator CsrA n=1 Tax=Ktedonobacter racemifer DSM 44963 TaxID=485913 RepID=D6TGQ9_KTERA|nr:carbon storage regulator [Ktedonobacter racemifer]EFH88838.1 carbon storage regulator, CsrA [Ktedonobacter racemifer DSM 44963]
MLVIRRKTGERIILSGNILIEVLEVNEGRAKLGITAPPEVDIVREELLQRQIPLSQPPVTKPE